jgi:5-methylcytosine-specific restriction endonuclease McrA
MKAVTPNEKTTLLLNNAWMPITTVSARAAFFHLWKKRVTALDKNSNTFHGIETWNALAEFHEDQPYMRSASGAWPIPTVIVVTSKFFRRPKKKRLSLYELAKLCDFKCQYCFEKLSIKELTLDHVYPKSKGGGDHHENLVLACRCCNRAKGSIFPFYDKNGEIPSPPIIPALLLNTSVIRSEWVPFIRNINYK